MGIFSDIEAENGENGREANNLLYNLLVDELSSTYDRQVTLSVEQSTHFMQHVKSRFRSVQIYPYPFKIENFTSLAEDKKTESKLSQSDTSSSYSQTKSNQSLLSVPKNTYSPPSIHTQASSAKSGQENASTAEKDSTKAPTWKCFIKGGNSTFLALTFIPASFKDVICLNKSNNDPQSSEVEEKPNQSSIVKTAVDSSVTHIADKAEKTENECNNSTEDTAAENIDPDNVFEDTVADSVNSQPEEIIRPEEEESRSQIPLCVPVYIYDCLVQNVLESLINPWDFQLPADIYQDMTFDLACETNEGDGQSSPRSLKRVSFSVEILKVNDFYHGILINL